jgi:hypothetical protein
VPKFSTNFEEILSGADWNFERQIGTCSLPLLLLIISLLLLLIMDIIIISARYNYYVSNKSLFEECD